MHTIDAAFENLHQKNLYENFLLTRSRIEKLDLGILSKQVDQEALWKLTILKSGRLFP